MVRKNNRFGLHLLTALTYKYIINFGFYRTVCRLIIVIGQCGSLQLCGAKLSGWWHPYSSNVGHLHFCLMKISNSAYDVAELREYFSLSIRCFQLFDGFFFLLLLLCLSTRVRAHFGFTHKSIQTKAAFTVFIRR